MTNHPNRAVARNIRNAKDREALIKSGYSWVVVVDRGDNKGAVRSKHKSYEAANKATPNGTSLTIVELSQAQWF